jgi:hypothetical protein
MTDEPIRRPKRPRDPNQLAKAVVDVATGEIEDARLSQTPHGRKGGLVGGASRAKALTAEERTAIAKKGANARWRKDQVPQDS